MEDPDQRPDFVHIRDEQGGGRGIMDATTAAHLASTKPDPNQAELDALLASVTRIRIISVSDLFSNRLQNPDVLLDTEDRASVAAFRDCLTIVVDPSTFGHCMCFGNPHLELFAGSERIARLGYHHGYSIRWDAWKYDAQLAEPDRLLDWMTEHGVLGPQREVDLANERARRSRASRAAWEEATPKFFQRFLEMDDFGAGAPVVEEMLDVLRTALPDRVEQGLCLFQWFGSGLGPWSGFPSYEDVPERLLLAFSTDVLIEALTRSEPNDRQWLGAARYFGGWNFSQQKRADRALLSDSLRRRLMDAALATGIEDNIQRARAAFQ